MRVFLLCCLGKDYYDRVDEPVAAFECEALANLRREEMVEWDRQHPYPGGGKLYEDWVKSHPYGRPDQATWSVLPMDTED